MNPSSPPPSNKSRFDTIDVLRGLSILAVVLLHISIRLNGAHFSLRPLFAPWLFHLLFRNGNNGVTVFFAVSGFLITITSLRRFGSLALMRPLAFYRIRFARIAPSLLVLLAILAALHLLNAEGFVILPSRSTLPRALFAALTFHLNWLEAAHGYLPASWDVLWSLSVEEMFYLFFPLICVGLLRLRYGLALFLTLLLVFVACGPFARTVWAGSDIRAEKAYLGGMDGIALGCLAAFLTNWLVQTKRAIRRGALIALEIAGAAMILTIATWSFWPFLKIVGEAGLDSTVLAIGTCLVMIASVLLGQQGSRWTAPLRWFGRHSYEVYLTHEFLIIWGTILYVKVQRGPLLLWVVAMLLLSAPLGWVVARYFSEPWNRRIRSTVPRGGSSSQQVSPWAKS